MDFMEDDISVSCGLEDAAKILFAGLSKQEPITPDRDLEARGKVFFAGISLPLEARAFPRASCPYISDFDADNLSYFNT
jgi:hypothetical protein